ncbi:hypothetical protein BOTBODRAFT_175154 [Botryobasidium botryosum FD-172 SS1]|uniref:Transmembrane protein n=1 Tax=Botryobasidium botryosum (strain FD-172 SS1) TaxID=930990 RepID=A0A067MR26_BOTB1|nr:hypothetical protein BOTBODRAFT_175154 [Botryobasidium botryosum FD-172 SS1]
MIRPLALCSILFLFITAEARIKLVDLDDVDDPPIVYNGTWSHLTNPVVNGVVPDYWKGTTSSTTTPGNSATLKFTGVQVTYWADKDINNANIVVMLDGSSNTISVTAPGLQTQQVLFNSTGLANTTHTLVITHAGKQGDYMNVDHIQYGVLEAAASRTRSAGSSATSGASKSTNSITSTGSSNSNVAIIAGSVAGGVLVLLGLIGGIIYARRKSKADSDMGSTAGFGGGNQGQEGYHGASSYTDGPTGPDFNPFVAAPSRASVSQYSTSPYPTASMTGQPLMHAPYSPDPYYNSTPPPQNMRPPTMASHFSGQDSGFYSPQPQHPLSMVQSSPSMYPTQSLQSTPQMGPMQMASPALLPTTHTPSQPPADEPQRFMSPPPMYPAKGY